MSETKAPKCPGCGGDMELFQIAAGGWRYGCIACATSFKSIKRQRYGWVSPIKSTKERAYSAAVSTAQPNWISVRDGLPNKDDRVLVYRPSMEDSDVGPISIMRGWNSRRDKEVTHWMPLPSLPKEESTP